MPIATASSMPADTACPDKRHAESETYMLWRDERESRRLDVQHTFFKHLFGGHLLHPQIPIQSVKNVADVGTGTGAWLIETAASLKALHGSNSGSFVGFDISDAQFHADPDVEYVVHDTTQPYPERYTEFFDVVHVRLLSYGIRADQMEKTVRNIASILKPGGYLHWEEADIIDTMVTSDSQASRRRVATIVEERLARGLTPAIVTPLVRTITDLRSDQSIPDIKSQEISLDHSSQGSAAGLNTLTWNNKDVLRLLDVTTTSSAGHPSDFVQQKKSLILHATYKTFLEIGCARRRKIAFLSKTSEDDKARLLQEAEEMDSYVDHPDLRDVTDDAEFTRLLAKKAFLSPVDGPWQTAML